MLFPDARMRSLTRVCARACLIHWLGTPVDIWTARAQEGIFRMLRSSTTQFRTGKWRAALGVRPRPPGAGRGVGEDLVLRTDHKKSKIFWFLPYTVVDPAVCQTAWGGIAVLSIDCPNLSRPQSKVSVCLVPVLRLLVTARASNTIYSSWPRSALNE